MLNLNSIMIGSMHPEKLAAFYEKVFMRPADNTEGTWSMWQAGSCNFSIGEHSEVKGMSKEPERLILNFETTDVKKEFERIKAAGGKVVKEPYEMMGAWIATFADPDGNFFQLMPPWDSSWDKK